MEHRELQPTSPLRRERNTNKPPASADHRHAAHARANRRPAVTARLYDVVTDGRSRELPGAKTMELTVYLPSTRCYRPARPWEMIFTDCDGVRTALRLSGAAMAIGRDELRTLCWRLLFTRDSVADQIRTLAAQTCALCGDRHGHR